MSFNINENIKWVGKTDWELRKFHGEELSTFRGSSYNSYLIRDEKTVLIDTVWTPFAEEFISNLENEIGLDKIDYIIANHGETDHSGALPLLAEKIPDTPIYCSGNAVKSLRGQFHKDFNLVTVKTGDKLSIGKKDLIFIEARMLHWPDSMFAYLTGDEILFSNDAFGQHYANEFMFNDLVPENELYEEAIKYYANILAPFSSLVAKKIQEVLSFNLPVKMICPSHGVIWRKNPEQIIEKYLSWADAYQENQVTIVYDTMWNGTRRMAEEIAEGIKLDDKNISIKLFNSARHDINTIATEIFKSKAVIAGSPTVNKGFLASLAALLEFVKGLGFKNKKAASFGCYGWSGESVKIINDELRKAGFEIIDEGMRTMWHPGKEDIAGIHEFGRKISQAIK